MPGAPVLPETVRKYTWLFFVETVAESHSLLLQVSTTTFDEVRKCMHRSAIRQSIRFFQELVRQHGEIMIVAKGIRQGVNLVRQCPEMAELDRLQHLELVPQIFHLFAPFM